VDESHNLIIPDPLRLSSAKRANANHGKTCVLGASRLQEIWDDMEKTTLPSWCSPALPRIGDKGQGKISADGWRVFCTVHLIVTLGRLWGPLPPDSRENQLFKNFCDLVAATKIATGRRITVVRVEEFHDLMLRYLRGLNELFPTLICPVSPWPLKTRLLTLSDPFRCFPGSPALSGALPCSHTLWAPSGPGSRAFRSSCAVSAHTPDLLLGHFHTFPLCFMFPP
jgi:hypothetical protein